MRLSELAVLVGGRLEGAASPDAEFKVVTPADAAEFLL